jgi:hypothetical protein
MPRAWIGDIWVEGWIETWHVSPLLSPDANDNLLGII